MNHTPPSEADTLGIPALSPLDEFNQSLRDNVHPPDWTNPKPSGKYNLVVIGAGAAGLVTAAGAAGLGAKVALVERSLLGGDCLNVGCVPSKALIRSARAAADAREAGAFGVDVSGEVSVDFAAVMQRMRQLRSTIAPHDSAQRFRDLGIDVFIGQANFQRPGVVRVGEQDLPYARAVIATGARAAAPPIPGLDQIDYLTNETVFNLTELPASMAVIGAGPIGCELAQSFARFGTEVHLIESQHGVLPREDPEAAELVKQSLLKDGVQLHCCGRNLKIESTGDKKKLSATSHDADDAIKVDQILVAVGRAPNTDGLDLEAAGVEYHQQGVTVNDHLQTTNPNIYAAGDICHKHKFTHAADATSRIVIRNALLGFLPFKAKASKLVMPWCTYTDPEIAHVGKYPDELKSAGVAFETVSISLAGIDRAILEGETNGLLKVHVRPNGQILGATLVGRHAGETIGELTTAMTHGIKLHKMAAVIHPYPTQAEIIKRAADQFFKTRLLRMKDKVFKIFGK